MKAAVLYGREDLRIEEVFPARLDPGEVRIAVEAALTCGTDLKVFKRGYHARMIVPPSVFGHELAGVITEVHPIKEHGGNSWKVGDRVVVANSAPCNRCFYCGCDQENLCEDLLFLNGAYAESVVVPARVAAKNMIELQAGTAFVDAALVEPLACVVQGFTECALKAAQRVLVIGAGPIGLMFAALARHAGCEVVVAGRGSERLARAEKLGASTVFDVGHEPTDWVDRFKKAHGELIDVVIEAVGTTATWEAALRIVRKGGLVNFFGGCPSASSITLDSTLMHYSSLRLLASFHHTPRAIRRALELIEGGIIRAEDFVDGECSLSELPQLFRRMSAGNRAIKSLVRVSN